MELHAAGRLARTLMDEHGLRDWHFAWDRARRRFGSCGVTRRTITLSAHLVQLNDEPQVRDTILHEIAHALAPGDNHGAAWQAACRRIGAKPVRCYREDSGGVVVPRIGLRVGCVRCNWWVGRHRITWAEQVCRKCRMPVTWEHVHTQRHYRIEPVPGGFRAVQIASETAPGGIGDEIRG